MSSILKVDTIQDASGNAIISSDGSGNLSIPNLTTTGDINFGDNDKAVFGASNDLQIFHDGTQSQIADVGTGSLKLRATNLEINNSADNQQIIQGIDGGAVTLFNNGSAKLSTTSSGVTVTGTVVSDGLTVDTDTLYVDSTNNVVGVGTSSPSTSFTFNVDSGTANNNTLFSSTDAGCSIYIADSISGVEIATASSGAMTFSINGNAGTGFSNTEAMRIDNSGNVGIGTSSPSQKLTVLGDGGGGAVRMQLKNEGNASGDIVELQLLTTEASAQANIVFGDSADSDVGELQYVHSDNSMRFVTNASEAMRINNLGYVGIDQTSPLYPLHIKDAGSIGSSDEIGYGFATNGSVLFQTGNANQMFLNDTSTSAGTHNYIFFRYNGATIGDIDTLDNSLIRYNTFTGGHWSQFHDGTNPELKKGTVMSLTGDKLEYSKCEKTITREETVANEDGTEEVQTREEVQKFEIAGTHEIGSEVTVPNDEYGEENSTTTATVVSNYTADHLVKVKVSDSVADKGVYGVWAGKYSDGDLSVEALGTSKIRIKQGEVLEVGDLLESAGDGTAQKQTDDTIKNSTIAKVTSPNVIETFDDNSFLVSCVLYCG